MSAKSSSPFNSSINPPSVHDCYTTGDTILISAAYNTSRAVLLLPLSILVLCLGWRQWRQQRSFASMSHSDIFTHHMAAMGLLWGVGSAVFFCGNAVNVSEMRKAGFWVLSISYYGESFFHLLTCIERYLAVVHPITYLGLRNARGVRIRNIGIACVWLQSFLWTVILNLADSNSTATSYFCPLVFCLVGVSFCSLSVLRALVRPGPGDKRQDKERVDKSKEKAFFTVMAITGVLWLWFVAYLAAVALESSPLVSRSVSCTVKASVFFFILPSTAVLPLLYLHRAGKLFVCCKKSG